MRLIGPTPPESSVTKLGLLPGVLIVSTFGIGLYVETSGSLDRNLTPEDVAEQLRWVALFTAIPAFVAGIVTLASGWSLAPMAF